MARCVLKMLGQIDTIGFVCFERERALYTRQAVVKIRSCVVKVPKY
jgi:hypothetical protein